MYDAVTKKRLYYEKSEPSMSTQSITCNGIIIFKNDLSIVSCDM